MADVIEFDALTGEITERAFTADEKNRRKLEAEALAEQAAAEEATRRAREAAIVKLANVAALTEDEKAALGL